MLKITKITLRNFMKHQFLEIDFREGVNAISGMNGSGKSSVITAIGFALFNHNPKSNQSMLIHKDRGTANIKLEFVINNTLYKLERSLGTSTYVALNYIEGGIENKFHSIKHVYQKIEEILEIDNLTRIFSNILSIDSSEIVTPFVSDLQRRREFFIGSLGLEKYEQVWSGLRPVISNLEGRLSSNEEAKDKGISLRKRMNSLALESTHLQDIVKKNKAQLEEIFLNINNLKNEKERYEAELKEKSRLENELHSSESRMKSYLSKNAWIEIQLKKLKKEDIKICPYCGQELNDEGKRLYFEQKSNEYIQSQTEINAQLKDVIELINKIKEDLSKYSEYDIEDRIEEGNRIYYELLNEIEVSEHKIKLNQDTIVELSINIKESLSTLRRNHSSAKAVKIINKIREGMRTISSTVNAAMIEDISSISSQFLSDILGKDCRIYIQKGYTIQSHIDGESFVFEQLSRGIQVMVGLAIRLAMTRFCSDLGIVFLDEPTINLHSDVRQNLLESIKHLGFSQIFVISHDDTFIASTDNLIRLGMDKLEI